MSWLKVFATVGVSAALVTTALAADVPRGYPPERPLPILERPRVSLFEGWYLRGDLGYAWGQIGSAQSPSAFASPSTNSLGNGFTGGVGAGFKSQWLRTDVTFDYLVPLKYQGTIATAGDVSAKISALSFLVNGYFDLGTWYRATPYIGAGIGAARMRVSEYQSTVAPPFASGTSGDQWNFAWALNAGVGYAISSNMMVDLGYRYINFGDTKSGADASGSMTFKNVAAHEVRVGLRWSFDDLPIAR